MDHTAGMYTGKKANDSRLSAKTYFSLVDKKKVWCDNHHLSECELTEPYLNSKLKENKKIDTCQIIGHRVGQRKHSGHIHLTLKANAKTIAKQVAMVTDPVGQCVPDYASPLQLR